MISLLKAVATGDLEQQLLQLVDDEYVLSLRELAFEQLLIAADSIEDAAASGIKMDERNAPIMQRISRALLKITGEHET